MVQIPILSGIYATAAPDFRTTYPHNLVPVPKEQGIAQGYLKPADGLSLLSEGVGPDRGGVEWDGVCYRVQGASLVSVAEDGTTVVIGNVGPGGPVTFDYSFDYLGIASDGRLYLYDGSILKEVTDPDLGEVLSFVWIDGYFVTTDGESLVTTELNDPFTVSPLKYGSSEIDPDPINSVLELRNEIYAVNSNSIEVFNNVGGSGFPFRRIEGAQIQKGSVGTHAAAVFQGRIAFVGGGSNDPPAVFLAANGRDEKISTREIDEILLDYTQEEVSGIVIETRNYLEHKWLYVHLADKTLVFDAAASAAMQRLVWFTLSGGDVAGARYPARGFVWCYGKWISGDPITGKIGVPVSDVSSHFGDRVSWSFGTIIAYNEGTGAIFHDLELVSLTGEIALGASPIITTQYSIDGVNWSEPRTVMAGKQGNRAKRISWRRQGKMRNYRLQRFLGNSDAHIAVSRLEARIEPLAF